MRFGVCRRKRSCDTGNLMAFTLKYLKYVDPYNGEQTKTTGGKSRFLPQVLKLGPLRMV